MNKKRFEILLGYIIVLALITLVVAAILFVQNRRNGGRYAELIKENVLYKVTNVLDGDTLMANVSGHEVTIRLIGMDTPEVVDPRKPIQCYGPEASQRAKEILYGRKVYLEKEKTKGNYDRYGRILAYVRFPDGGLYNEQMIREGYAREYTFNNEKYLYQTQFKKAQKEAKNEKRGLWEGCTK